MADCLNVKNFCWLSLSVLFLVSGIKSDRIAEKIYQRIDGGFSCFRRLNGTHQIGCSSSQSGNVGVVHFVARDADLEWIIHTGPDAPYVVLLLPDLFRRNTLTKLRDSGKVSGVVVLNSTTMPSTPSPPYSNDLTCPNRASGLYQDAYSSYCESNPWNPGGDGLMFEDLKFPIFFVNETGFNQSTLLDDCFFKFNRPVDGGPPSYPLCAIELKAFMWAAVDTPTCRRRGRLNMMLNPTPSEYCDPLGDVNIVVPLLATNKSAGPVRNRSVIFVAARMDSASMFDGLSVGADTAISSLVTLVAVADMLNSVKDQLRLTRSNVDNVYLVLLNGESFDYIGSSRMVYDMQRDNFPRPLSNDTPSQAPLVGLQHIKYWLELGALAPQKGQTVYLHTDPISTNDSSVRARVAEIAKALTDNVGGGIVLEPTDPATPLPPASLQSFLKKDLKIAGLVMTNYRRSFANQYYNNEWDTFQSINKPGLSKHLAGVARTVAGAVYQLASGGDLPPTITPNLTLVEQAIECYLLNANCTLFNWLLNVKSNIMTEGPMSTYVGVSHGDNTLQPLSLRTRYLMALASGDELPVRNKSDCLASRTEGDEIYQYYWMGESEASNSSGSCYRSTVKTTAAVSPAFEIEDYDWASGEYSSWTESRWETFSVRIFLKASTAQEVSVLSLGIVVLLLSFAATCWVESKAGLLFPISPGDDLVC